MTGNNPDLYPSDPTQCCDSDGDGWGDNANGTSDRFPSDSTQWMDTDNDGYGDNPAGTNPDPYPADHDNDGVPDNRDEHRRSYKKFDQDGDGIPDEDEGYVASRVANSDTGFILIILFVALALGVGGWFTRKMQFVDVSEEPEESLWMDNAVENEKTRRRLTKKSKDNKEE